MRQKANKLLGAKGRLLEYLDNKNVKNSDFYRATNLSNGFLDKNNNIGSDSIELIISKYPDLSLTWLITGEGEMLVKNDGNFVLIEKFLEKFSDVLDNHKKEHNDIINQDVKIVEQHGEVMKQNGEIIKQNSEILSQNAEVIKQNSALIRQNADAMAIIQKLSEKLK